MFHLIREYFAASEDRPPRKGRARKLAGLFAFEFVVVLLGVLAAQLLQSWMADRGDRANAQEAMASYRAIIPEVLTVAEFRWRTAPCLQKRMLSYAKIAGANGTIPDRDIQTPDMPMPSVPIWTKPTRALVERCYGREEVQRYDAVALLVKMIAERQRAIEADWTIFGLLAEEVAPAMDEDRSAVRLAAARVSGSLGNISSNSARLKQILAPLGYDDESLRAWSKMKGACSTEANTPRPLPQPKPSSS